MIFGIIIILCFLSVGLWIFVLLGLRTLLLRQRGFAERLNIIEEILTEWMDEEELLTEEPQQKVANGDSNKDESLELLNNSEVLDADDEFEPDNLSTTTADSVRGERARAIFMMLHQGLKPEEIAKQLGYSESEIQLVSNLYQNKSKSPSEVS
jgi:DNA-binding NarL/FixJ family response regulator